MPTLYNQKDKRTIINVPDEEKRNNNYIDVTFADGTNCRFKDGSLIMDSTSTTSYNSETIIVTYNPDFDKEITEDSYFNKRWMERN